MSNPVPAAWSDQRASYPLRQYPRTSTSCLSDKNITMKSHKYASYLRCAICTGSFKSTKQSQIPSSASHRRHLRDEHSRWIVWLAQLPSPAKELGVGRVLGSFTTRQGGERLEQSTPQHPFPPEASHHKPQPFRSLSSRNVPSLRVVVFVMIAC